MRASGGGGSAAGRPPLKGQQVSMVVTMPQPNPSAAALLVMAPRGSGSCLTAVEMVAVVRAGHHKEGGRERGMTEPPRGGVH
jgi:hypothetical protein